MARPNGLPMVLHKISRKARKTGVLKTEKPSCSALAGRPVKVQFTPHLLPMNRGILATVYVRGTPEDIHASLARRYRSEPFLKVLPYGGLPSTRDVRGSNYVHIGVVGDRIAGRAVVVAVLDNLTKGSSGQALQNANLMLGLEETTGLLMAPVFP